MVKIYFASFFKFFEFFYTLQQFNKCLRFTALLNCNNNLNKDLFETNGIKTSLNLIPYFPLICALKHFVHYFKY